MGRINNLGVILVGIWLVAQALVILVPSLNIAGVNTLLAVLALAAGALLLIGTRKWRSNLGLILLGIWLILSGLLTFITIPIEGVPTLMALLALAAGVLLLLRRP